ncbi:amino acid ABC transporter substrate-binding protein [Labrys wisconsinensis]|uniref:General L-amino acid transport system substrate-binding protein n=1 Tax=Labrys wisconsinensis TaxID=425677 RepID=A0ABU0J561_9HYPH|nr:amino acid ABC transporter substrate-binding protein [Labrys wisconsinensis]MDQ0468332.1 general L-amino acid transport system substrate-binding protein [Labrys wisconsinensis]
MKTRILAAAFGAALAWGATAASATTLETVKNRGQLICGSNPGLAGFGAPNDKGEWSGFDVDYCRAIAAAIFGDPTKVKFVPLSAKDRFTSLSSGDIDVLVRNTTWTLGRDTQNMDFPATNFYDGQGFMVKKSAKISSALELSGATVCVQQGTTTELNLADFFRANNLPFQAVTFATSDETRQAYDSGRCDAFTTDASGLYAERLKLTNPDDNIVLPEIISKEPLGPAVRHGDNQWGDIVRWVHFALLTAEEDGVTQANVDEMLKSDKPDIKRLLGTEGDFGKALGLENNWAYNIIKSLGNYGEIFDRNVGAGSPLKIDRGLNALWTKKGLQYAPPIR